MRRALPLLGIAHDGSASASFTTVAVVLLLGASLSYAYMAHLQAERERSEGLEPWSDSATAILDEEVSRMEGVVRGLVEASLHSVTNGSSGQLVSTVGAWAEAGFRAWADSTYPTTRGRAEVRIADTRLSITAVFGTVTMGNALGQQAQQRLPVSIEAVASAQLEAHIGEDGWVRRDTVLRVDAMAPQLLVVYQQDVLEHALADEGLVATLLCDAVSAKLAQDPDWEPGAEELKALVDAAIASVQSSLLRAGDGTPVEGPALLGLDTRGGVRLDPHPGPSISIEHPRTGERLAVQLEPEVRWTEGPYVQLRTSRLWGAEAGPPRDAVLGRLDVAGRFEHQVSVRSDGGPLASVLRDISFRTHGTAWAKASLDSSDGEAHFCRAQVEDWDDLEAAMGVVSPPPNVLPVDIAPAFGPGTELVLDGVVLGVFGPGIHPIPNVLAGPHELAARPTGALDAHCSTAIDVPFRSAPGVLRLHPEGEASPEALHAFWFSLMAAYHRQGAGPLAHLEHIAAVSGYRPLPARGDAGGEGDLEALLLWTEGLGRHLAFMGGKWDDKGVDDPYGCLGVAKRAVSLTSLTLKLATKVPRAWIDAGRATVLLGTVDGRAEFVVTVSSGGEVRELLRGTTEDGGCIVRSSGAASTVMVRVGNLMTALAVVGTALSVVFDVVELAEAVGTGDATTTRWAVVDLGIDMAKMVLCSLQALRMVGVVTIGQLGRSALSVVGAAITVVATFLDAYREAGEDLWGAFHLLMHPDGFSDALRTAGFLSGVASLVTTVVLTAALPGLTGATAAAAFATAVLAATGVGLLVFGLVLAVWAVLHWDEIRGFVSGTAREEDVADVRREVEATLASTMELRARLNAVDLGAEVAEARAERGAGLALMHIRTTSGDGGLVEALGRADHHLMDRGSAQGRRARAVGELRHWIEVLWREVDDLVDDDDPMAGAEESEGFSDYKGTMGSRDHEFDADIRVIRGGGTGEVLDQAGGTLVAFLRELDVVGLASTQVRLRIDGEVFAEALRDWMRALGAISEQMTEASAALVRASREAAYVAAFGAECAYDRNVGMVELRLPAGVDVARLEVEAHHGALLLDGGAVEGPVVMEVRNATTVLLASGAAVSSRLLDWTGAPPGGDITPEAMCSVIGWADPGFGMAVLSHWGEE